jgi:protocatechuate 4,5-dioxygenase alpha chain
MSLNSVGNRREFAADEAAYVDRYGLSKLQKQAVLDRDYLEMLRLGGNIYYVFKLAIFDGKSMQYVGGQMSGITEEAFTQMMRSGGRCIEGNRRTGEH